MQVNLIRSRGMPNMWLCGHSRTHWSLSAIGPLYVYELFVQIASVFRPRMERKNDSWMWFQVWNLICVLHGRAALLVFLFCFVLIKLALSVLPSLKENSFEA